jgi:THO complex subunit 4
VSSAVVATENLFLTLFFRRKPQGGGPIRTKSARPSRPGRKRPKTAEELDKELDSFMNDDSKPNSARKEGENVTSSTQLRADGDVEMAT